MNAWQPIETADTNMLFATSTWVLVAREDGFVTEAMPFYTSATAYIWITGRSDNIKGKPDSQYLRYAATHWMPLPLAPKTLINGDPK